jgi:hypothetical protein
VADVAILVIHHLPDDPPTGDLFRLVMVVQRGGYPQKVLAVSLTRGVPAEWGAWWFEVPSLPSDPSERLTTDDVEGAATACDDVASDLFNVSLGRSGSVTTWRERAARLRKTLPGKEGAKWADR